MATVNKSNHMINYRRRRGYDFLFLVTVVAILSTATTTTHAFVHPFARPVGSICNTATTAPATTSLTRETSTKSVQPRTATIVSSKSGTTDDGLSRAEVLRLLGSSVLKAGGGVLAGVALCGSSGSGGAAFALDEQQQQFTDMRDGLELKAQEDELKENVRMVSGAAAGLKTLSSKIEEKEYRSIRQAMRSPPISNLRTSTTKVIKVIPDDGVKAKTQAAYKALISSVEELDRFAKDGESGSLKDNKAILAAYDKCVEQGDSLVSVLPTI